MKRKICIIITTRGNYAKMKSVISKIQESPELELQTIAAGGALLPKYGSIVNSLTDNHIQVDRYIYFLVEGENPVTMAKSAGLAVTEFSTAFENLNPDLVIVIADRFECLPVAMVAAYMNIPVAHIEGGEVSGSVDESIRHAITKLSHLHFPATVQSAERLRKLGEAPETIFTVGSTSLDVISRLDLDDMSGMITAQKTRGVGAEVDLSGPYLVVIQHPVTTEYAQNLEHIRHTIEAIHRLKINTVWIWPNMDAGSDGISKGIRMFRENYQPDHVHFFKSLPIELFAPLLRNSACMVGNSSSGIREAGFLGVPSVNIGTRQSGRERCRNTIDADYDSTRIMAAIRRQMEHGPYEPDHLYGDGHAGERIVEVLKEAELTIQKRITY
ncbi:MAG: UDP-N-acetylglucosamine 2-epimerase [Thermodesulfobacteriota bacterium]